MTTSVAVKPPCRVQTTAAITLSGEQTVNGVAVVTGDRVLVKDQASSVDNGIYIADTSAWSRAPDFDGSLDAVDGTLVLVHAASGPDQIYELSATNPVVIGTSALTFSMSSLTTSAFGATLIAAATAAVARGLLGSTTVGDALFIAATAAAARTVLEVRADSQATGKLLGRTTAGTGVSEEISIGNGLTMTAGTLSSTAVTANNVNDFRLTLTTAVPITITDVTGATTIYAAPLKGNSIALYDGVSAWNVRQSAEFSVALGTLTSGLPYDLFVYDNAGVPTFRSPVAWTNGTTRATALTKQDGILVKTGATTDRYVGTFYTTSTTATEDSEANRYLFNYYNQVERIQSVVDTTNSWGWTTATWHQANASAANQFNAVIGVADTLVEIDVHGVFTNAGGAGAVGVGVGVNSTTVNSAKIFGGNQQLSVAGSNIDAKYRGYPAVGLNTFAWLEISFAGGTTTFYGDSGTTHMQTGMMGKFKG